MIVAVSTGSSCPVAGGGLSRNISNALNTHTLHRDNNHGDTVASTRGGLSRNISDQHCNGAAE